MKKLFKKLLIITILQYRAIGLMGGVFANGPGDRGSISRSSHTKDSKMVLDATLLNTQHYKVWIKGSGAMQGME